MRYKGPISKAFLLIPLFVGLQSFNPKTVGNDFNYQLSVSVDGDDFTEIANELYDQVGLCEDNIDRVVFEKGLRGYIHLKYTNELTNDRYLTVLDFSKRSDEKRLWVIDLQTKQVLFNELVAHGRNSGDKYATSFSNTPNSRKSSLGFYVTGETYNGKHRYSMKLRGLEPGFNNNAFARGIVMHGATYVSEEIAEAQSSVGRSFGCPAVSNDVNHDMVDMLKEGSCLFMYHPQSYYNGKSKILNSGQYIPIELLKALVE